LHFPVLAISAPPTSAHVYT